MENEDTHHPDQKIREEEETNQSTNHQTSSDAQTSRDDEIEQPLAQANKSKSEPGYPNINPFIRTKTYSK